MPWWPVVCVNLCTEEAPIFPLQDFNSRGCITTWHAIRDHVQRSYLIAWEAKADHLCVFALVSLVVTSPMLYQKEYGCLGDSGKSCLLWNHTCYWPSTLSVVRAWLTPPCSYLHSTWNLSSIYQVCLCVCVWWFFAAVWFELLANKQTN